MLFITLHDLFYTWKFVQYLVTPSTHFVPPHPTSGNHPSVLLGRELVCLVSFNIPHVSEIIHHLSVQYAYVYTICTVFNMYMQYLYNICLYNTYMSIPYVYNMFNVQYVYNTIYTVLAFLCLNYLS